MQILAIQRQAAPTPHRFRNPRPPGVFLPGSASEAVLDWLVAQPGAPRAWWTCQQIITGTGHSRKAVGWALIYLRRLGLVEYAGDARNSRYMRYRAKA